MEGHPSLLNLAQSITECWNENTVLCTNGVAVPREPLDSSLTAPAYAALLIVGDGASAKTLEMLQQRVKRQENLLQRCKETIRSHKEQCMLLTSEKEALQEQLDERLQELEKMKVKEKMIVV